MSKLIRLAETPPKLHKGCLYVDGDPVYIVEMLEDGNDPTMITIFKVQPKSDPPVKEFKPKLVTPTFSTKTILGRLAAKKYRGKQKAVRVIEESPPLFMTPVVYGFDTFTGADGRGFWEREEDKLEVVDGKVTVTRGERTGVFISLDSVTWEKIVIPTGEVLKQWRAQETLFFKL